jgi:hypothetical protein
MLECRNEAALGKKFKWLDRGAGRAERQGEVQIVRGARDTPHSHRKASDQGIPIQEMMGARIVETTHDLG